jgi:hypothetical protein
MKRFTSIITISIIIIVLPLFCFSQENNIGVKLQEKDSSQNSRGYAVREQKAITLSNTKRIEKPNKLDVPRNFKEERQKYASTYDTIAIGYRLHENDTLRTFGIFTDDVDKSIATLIEIWGEPKSQSAGKIIWKNVNIPGLKKHTSIEIRDGWLSAPSNSHTIKLFSSEDQKISKLSNLRDFECRHTVAIFTNSRGRNIVNSPELEQLVHDYLESILY